MMRSSGCKAGREASEGSHGSDREQQRDHEDFDENLGPLHKCPDPGYRRKLLVYTRYPFTAKWTGI